MRPWEIPADSGLDDSWLGIRQLLAHLGREPVCRGHVAAGAAELLFAPASGAQPWPDEGHRMA